MLEEKNKKILIGSGIGLLIIVLLLVNIGLIQVTYYSMTQNPQKVINVISKDARNPEMQKRLYVNLGLDYLVKDLSETSTTFLEKNFLSFEELRRQAILRAYNQKGIFMRDNKALLGVVSTLETIPQDYKNYFKRMDMGTFERILNQYFGENPKLTQTVVKELYHMSSAYGKKLPLDKFKFSVYDLMSFPHEGDANSLALRLLGNIEPEAIKNNLFAELKTKPVQIDDLEVWVNILQKYNVVTTEQYAGFNNSYASVVQLRTRYKQLEAQEVDLMNMKDKIDVQTNGITLEKEKYVNEKVELDKQLAQKREELDRESQYQVIKLYVMDFYGDGQYEASIPEKSWFFDTYKPTNEKVVIKVTNTHISKQGVYDFKVYNKGTHNSGIPYFVELSSDDLGRIQRLESEVQSCVNKVQANKQEIAKRDEEISVIRKSQGYDEIITSIEDVKKSKEKVVLDLEGQKVAVQNLFGIGHVEVTLQTKK
ncbi:MAG: hypothetical protein ACRCW2_03645 [Cellulosilyticaceae bacterium]